jgi:hypothetical protein
VALYSFFNLNFIKSLCFVQFKDIIQISFQIAAFPRVANSDLLDGKTPRFPRAFRTPTIRACCQSAQAHTNKQSFHIHGSESLNQSALNVSLFFCSFYQLHAALDDIGWPLGFSSKTQYQTFVFCATFNLDRARTVEACWSWVAKHCDYAGAFDDRGFAHSQLTAMTSMDAQGEFRLFLLVG